jgi:hypothetical protein
MAQAEIVVDVLNIELGKRLVDAVRRAHEVLYEEYTRCPWCFGHIGYEKDYHDTDCIWLKVAPGDWEPEGGDPDD